MPLRIKALMAIPVIVGLMAASAEAQLLVFPTWETQITLTQQDLDMIHNAVTNQVHGKPVGTKASWSNPRPSGLAGRWDAMVRVSDAAPPRPAAPAHLRGDDFPWRGLGFVDRVKSEGKDCGGLAAVQAWAGNEEFEP